MNNDKKTKKIEMKNSGKLYNVYVGNGIVISDKIKEVYDGNKITVITDENVNNIYGKNFRKILEDAGFDIFFIVIKAGEENKNLDTVADIYKQLAMKNFTRSDLIIALGGGIVGDVSGFVAATYMRGVEFINIPTTLLSQVDSCIGGKTGVNTEYGKNMVGTFYNPISVIVDVNFLKSLTKELISDGLAEIIKYGLIYDLELFKLLENHSLSTIFEELEDIVYKSLLIKKYYVTKDAYDNGIRMILNFGHTYGHIIENYFNYKLYTHGQAVAMGMSYITKISEENGFTKIGTLARIKEVLKKYELPFEMPDMCLDEIPHMLSHDKKNRAGELNYIMLKEIGSAEIVKKDLAEEII